MVSFNLVTFIGRAGTDPEMQKTPEDTSVSSFRLAVSTYAGKDESGNAKVEPMWLTVKCWRNLAEQVQKIVNTGVLVLVSGKLVIRKYTDKNNQEQTAVEVVANTVELLQSKSKKSAEAEDTAQEAA